MKSKIKMSLLALLSLLTISCSNSDDSNSDSQSSAKKINSFVISGVQGNINESSKTIVIELSIGTNISSLTPIIGISQNATVNPSSNSAQDFTNSVSYVVTAQDNSTVTYVATASLDECVDASNIYSFTYNNKTYEIVKETKNWQQAAACAAERGGYLAEINDSAENSALFNQLSNNAGINISSTTASDGGGASYVWIGGNDIFTEGNWIWDGDNNGTGNQFWQGDANGSAVNGLYNKWGNEPDNFNGNQDGLGLALTEWPLGSGSLGTASQWNDVAVTNALYFVIEYD